MTRDVDFEIGADVSPLKQKLREARDAVKSFADEGGSFDRRKLPAACRKACNADVKKRHA